MRDRHTVRTTGPHTDQPFGGILQRKCACGQHTVAGGGCSDCAKKGLLQRNAANSETPAEVPPVVHEVLSSPGQPLDPSTRAFMEPRLGHDFSMMSAHAHGSAPVPATLTIGAANNPFEQKADAMAERVVNHSITPSASGFDFKGVRVHADEKAADSARSLNALAYTVGQHIVFGERQYQPQSVAGRKLLAHELTHVVQQSAAPVASVIARQPAGGWSDATGTNKEVTTVDDQGKIQPGKLTTAGVWRVPIEGLTHGFQDKSMGTAIEAAGKRAIALIPNTVKPPAGTDKEVPIDVLVHMHGHGIGYRELKSGNFDYGATLKPGEVRDVALYQMEQQLLAHIKTSNRLLIAILPQGSLASDFGDLKTKGNDYLTEVFGKLVPAYLPKGAVPGRVIFSGHSGAGPTAMSMANQRAGKRTDVMLFDAIQSSCTEREPVIDKDGKEVKNTDGTTKTKCKKDSPCTSNEVKTVKNWIENNIKADILNLSGTPQQQQADLQKNGTRFRGVTSNSLNNQYSCTYGYWYNEVKNHIENQIKVLKVPDPVRNQLRQNYKVEEATGLGGLTGMERHERLMGQGNLESALKD